MSDDRGVVDDMFVPVVAPQVSTALFDDEAVLYDAETARPVLLNVTAAAVWSMIDGVLTVGSISVTLADRFDADPAAVAADVARTITRFRDLGLLQGVPAAPPTVR